MDEPFRATIGGRDYVRDPEGVWRYPDSLVPVPDARDSTLSEQLRPKFIGAPNEPPDDVLLSLDQVRQDPSLRWCLEYGVVVPDREGHPTSVIVPFTIWNEHDGPRSPDAPELSDESHVRGLAEAERRYREALRDFQFAGRDRLAALRLASAAGMTRRRAAEITGLSPGRVQQLVAEPKDALSPLATEILKMLGNDPPSGRRLVRATGATREQVREAIEELLARRFIRLELDSEPRGWRATAEGLQHLGVGFLLKELGRVIARMGQKAQGDARA